ncbi:MAG TPA: response regulator [Candidatus Angelobacter sp.]|nr:response regulator [Candidatus Angelobacter sp.]
MKTSTLEEIQAASTMEPLRVLILEDSRTAGEEMLLQLKGIGVAIEATLVEDQKQFRRALSEGDFAVVLSNYRLPNWTGLEALKELRECGKATPFLLVTGALGDEAAVECIKQGVDEYLLRENIGQLPTAFKRALQERARRVQTEGAQRALAEREANARRQLAELEVIYQRAPVGLAVYDRSLRFLRVNEALARFNQLSPAEHVGRRVDEITAGFGKDIAPCLEKVFVTGESILNVERHRTAPGNPAVEQQFLTSYYPLRGEDGKVFAVCAVVLETSERKRAEEVARLTEARNRDLVNNSVYGIFRATAEGRFLDANPALLKILGCNKADELKSFNLAGDVYRFPEQYAQHLAECRSHGVVHGAEAEWRRRDGGIVGVRLHLRHISTAEEGETIEFMTEDVTAWRAMERQLQQAQKFEAVGQLAGGVAHDFNNVVGAIQGWAELGIEENKGRSKASERFARIKEQTERAAALTRELLAFARRQVLQPRAVDINTVTSGLTSFLGKVIGGDVELKVITNPIEPVRADPTQLEQVLMNLCLNARDAMPVGGRLVVETEMVELDDSFCRFYPEVKPGRYAVLSVSDTGVGMDTETREHIFEPFFTTKERSKGTGMGLATVYGIIKQHGGFIHVYSEPGQGSLFRVYLPVLEAAPQERAPARAAIPSLAEMKGTETILLADDHESIREMARQTLMSLGYRVLSAGDGEEALRLCQTEAPALAILDVVMPKMGGPAVAEKLIERYGKLPILFASGYSQDSEGVATVSYAQYLQKPYSPTTLGCIVREILDEAEHRTVPA